ncbi:MAG: hypothetical protein PF961_12175 [Planctomycetota bacterium]|jgi:hypothetical protein|nr:hypothetical protein [Planctomycetota bacterium]
MKEDILEQLTEDYLNHYGYFTMTNVKYRPPKDDPDYNSRQDSVASDIDVLAVHPTKSGINKVIAVTCKSWQSGFWPEVEIRSMMKTVSGRVGWKRYRELWMPIWSRAFQAKVAAFTGTDSFIHLTTVTMVGDLKAQAKGKSPDTSAWESCPRFRDNLPGCQFRVLALQDMVGALQSELTTTVANSSLSRTLQLMKTIGVELRRMPPPTWLTA